MTKQLFFRACFALALLAVPSAAQAQGCTFSISRTTVLAGPEGPIFARTTVTASGPGCQWSTTTAEPWISVNPNPQVGTGDAGITLAPNPGATRIGLVTVAGQTVTVTQQATACVTSLVPNALTFPYPGFGDPADQRKTVTVNAPADCHWQHAPWPIVLSPNPTFGGVGTQTVNVGIITILPGQGNTINAGIGSLPLTLTRLDPPCVFTLTPSSPTVSVSGGSGVINVTGTGTDCSFTAAANGTGLTITNQSAPAAPATISYAFAANPGAFQRSATISVPNASVTVTQNGPPVRTDVTSVSFAGIRSGATVSPLSPAENIQLTIDEQPGSAWSVSVNQPWLVVTPSAGSGPATLRVTVDAAAAATLVPPPFPSPYSAQISITAAFAPVTAVRTVLASLTLKTPGTSAAPTGVFETPLNNTAVSGATPVTGWAIDDIDVARIQLYRDPVAGEGTAEVYIGDAIRVTGARPDIAARSSLPQARRAGWGYMLLTNVLPGGGNGTFTLSAYVDDLEGNRALLGRRTVTVDNATAVRPFGTIDAPAQGETVSGTLASRGWVLTPQTKTIPLDGSTIKVYIDGVLLSPVSSYNNPRPDVKAFFPDLANSDGPEARLSIDTTLLADGVHTIAWGVIDDAGVAEGIGSRYFTVQNGMSSLVWEPAAADARSAEPVSRLPMLRTDVWSREGVDETAWATRVATDADGKRTLHVSRGQRVELFLDPTLRAACGSYAGHLLAGEVAGPLPAGGSLEPQRGIFRWQPTAEVSGVFEYVFVQRGCDTLERRIPVRVVIEPRR